MIVLESAAEAQTPPPPAPLSAPTVQEPKAPPKRAPRRVPRAAPAPAPEEPIQPSATQKPTRHVENTAAEAITCSGTFVKDTTHNKIAAKYGSRNVVFGQVDGPDNSKIPASVLFPNDPKRRLEVIWNNEATRSEIHLIAINGKSHWSAPKGVKLGLALVALEKINGRPFTIHGFGADGAASVLDWNGGTLDSLPGGCKVGIRLFAEAKSTEASRGAKAADKDVLSNDASLRASKLTVGEILIGY